MRGGRSYWLESARSPGYARLEGDRTVPVAVAGGGLAGLTTALLLKHAGFSVAVLEAAEIGSGVTGHTTGKITAGQGLAYSRIEETHGEEASRRYAASQSAGLELVFRLAESCGIDCDLERVTNWVFAERENQLPQLQAEARAARRAGLAVELEGDLDVPFPALAGLGLDGQAQFHARSYVLGLARRVHGEGSSVHERTRVVRVETDKAAVRLETETGTVTAEHVVLATNAPITSEGMFFARLHPSRAYAVAAPVDAAPLDGMWVNVGSPTRSLRTAPLPDGRRLLIAVGEGHKTGREHEPPHYDALGRYLAEHFGVAPPTYRWSTQDQYPVDGLPYIGRLGDDGLYVATGFAGWGLTNGSVSGMVIRDLILGRDNAWAALFDPGRSSLRRSPTRLVKENAIVAKELLMGKLRRRPDSLADVAPGTGQVLSLEGEKAAVYLDDSGEAHAISAVCTHMGCDVAFNAAERTWDCPCHGSRFSVDGEVLQGPATRALAPVDLGAPTHS